MNQGVLSAIIAVVSVAAIALWLRRTTGPAAGAISPGTPPPPPPDLDEPVGDQDSPEIVAVTSDGWSFVPVGDRDKLQLIPPRTSGPPAQLSGQQGAEQLARGDLIAARIKRGAPDHDPWRLEGLGRDHEYRAWRFETEEAARSALALVMERVVRPPRDVAGEPIPVGHADFAEARRREEEIEAELATMSGPGEGPGEPLG